LGDQEVVFALVTVGSGKAVRQNSAFEIAAKCLLDMRGRRRIALPGRERQPSLEVCLDCAVPQRPFWAAALVAPGAWYGTFDCGIHGATPS